MFSIVQKYRYLQSPLSEKFSKVAMFVLLYLYISICMWPAWLNGASNNLASTEMAKFKSSSAAYFGSNIHSHRLTQALIINRAATVVVVCVCFSHTHCVYALCTHFHYGAKTIDFPCLITCFSFSFFCFFLLLFQFLFLLLFLFLFLFLLHTINYSRLRCRG